MNTLECGIVILPPKPLAAETRRLQAEFPPAWVPPYPPHITVKGQFRCLAARKRIEAAIARACAGAQAFPLTVDGWDCFCGPGDSVFYLAVLPSEPLQALHENLLQALSPLTELSGSVTPGFEGDAYHPHITLLRDVPAAEIEGARARLAAFRPTATFPVASVKLICHQPDRAWQRALTFPLGVPTPGAAERRRPAA